MHHPGLVSPTPALRRSVLLLASLAVIGCRQGAPAPEDWESYFAFSRRAIPAEELLGGAEILFGVDPGSDPNWVFGSLRSPEGVGMVNARVEDLEEGTLLTGYDSVFSFGAPGPGPSGEAPGVIWFPLSIRHADPRVGDQLSFRVRLILDDSSVVEWEGPPGSERPAPLIVVVRSPSRVGVLVASVAAGAALLVLLGTGLFWIRLRRRHSR